MLMSGRGRNVRLTQKQIYLKIHWKPTKSVLVEMKTRVELEQDTRMIQNSTHPKPSYSIYRL